MEDTEVMEQAIDEARWTSRWHVAVWLAVVASACMLAALDHGRGWLGPWGARTAGIPYESLVLLVAALGCEFVDATIGMGYGTTLTPLLILLGYPVGVIVPCAVLSQLSGNVSAAFFHQRLGNVDFVRDSKARNAALVIGGVGLVVAAGTVLLAIRLSPHVLKTAVSASIVAVGIFLVAGARFRMQFRLRNVAVLGAVAAFNKALSGGGYGPLVCGGQVIAGLDVRAAVGTTALAEAIVCASTAVAYFVGGASIPMGVLLPLTAGSLLSTPASAVALRRLPKTLARRLMGLSVVLLGVLALLKAVNG